jgi:predicted MFS family arabinose efflux permease
MDATDRPPPAAAASTRTIAAWAFAGFCALLLGHGFGRFAYTPILPALVTEGWLDAPGAAFLGAANLAGYLAGALAAPWLAGRGPPAPRLRAAMALTVLSLAACTQDLGFWWLFAWRALAGVTGGVLIVVGAPLVLGATPPRLRGLVSGAVFSGIGLGVVLAGTVVAALAQAGAAAAWGALAAGGAVLTLAAWRLWPAPAPRPPAPAGGAREDGRPPRARLLLIALGYASDGVGFVPHTLFLSDYVARGLERGVAEGAQAWVVFGIGAAIGPAAAGLVAGRTGFRAAFAGAIAVKAVAVALPILSAHPLSIAASALVVGALTPGMAALGSGVSAEVAGPRAYAGAWRWMTVAFAAAQAAGAYGMSALFGATGSHAVLFALGSGLLALGAAAALAGGFAPGLGPARGGRAEGGQAEGASSR